MAQKGIVTIVIRMMVVLGMMLGFVSCDKSEDMYNLALSPKGDGDITEVTINVTRNNENGIVTASREVNGLRQDTTITIPLGGVKFDITPADTIKVGIPEVTRTNFAQVGKESTESYETDGVYFTKTSKVYKDELNVYVKDINISYLDAYLYVWGKKAEFPKANGSVAAEAEINILDEGIKEKLHFYTATTNYKVAFMGGSTIGKGVEVLAIDADDTLISTVKTNEGYETLSETTARTWVEITRTYKISGTTVAKYEDILKNGITAPAYDVKDVVSFSLSSKPANLEEAAESGTRGEGNIKITSMVQNYVVGNNIFDRTFVLAYETAVLTVDGKTFIMPSRKYESIKDNNFIVSEMAGITGYDRKLYTHKMSASFNGNAASAKAEVELRKTEDAKDELISTIVVEDGKDYINATTTKSWVKVKEIWSISGEKVYTKSINLTNGIAAPSKITKELPSFELASAADVLGKENSIGSEPAGEFTLVTCNRSYTVGNNRFSRVFTMSYQKAVYNPIKHNMPYAEYENVADNGFNLNDMSGTSNDGRNYNRKGYVHNMSAKFNGYDVKSSAEAELLVEVEIPRETPAWLGAPKGAKYTRVQRAVGEKFMDMVVFSYENGVIMAPNGIVDMKLAYAFDASVASANGVETCLKGAYSGVFGANKWRPATVTITSGRWIYAGKDASWDHTVMENNTVTLGIGVDVTPIPSAQSFQIDGNLITIKYAVNNGSKTANTSLKLR